MSSLGIRIERKHTLIQHLLPYSTLMSDRCCFSLFTFRLALLFFLFAICARCVCLFLFPMLCPCNPFSSIHGIIYVFVCANVALTECETNDLMSTGVFLFRNKILRLPSETIPIRLNAFQRNLILIFSMRNGTYIKLENSDYAELPSSYCMDSIWKIIVMNLTRFRDNSK